MTLDQQTIEQLAQKLESAEKNLTPITKLTDDYPDLDWDDAYAIQTEIRKSKVRAGVRVAGLKAGLTSKAKMKQMNVEEPVFGFLCDYGAYADGAEVKLENFIAPRVEAEIAIVTKEEIKGPGCHLAEVIAASDFVVPAMEILDSRYEDFNFDLVSVVADNTSAAGFVVGCSAGNIRKMDLTTVGIVLEKNGAIVEVGAGAAVLGHPAESVVMLANSLARKGDSIPAGSFIMTGGITAAVAIDRGDSISARFQGLGQVSLRFV